MMVTKPCCVCKATLTEVMAVNFIERNTGPSWTLYACVPDCAEHYAQRPYAPDWLREELQQQRLRIVDD